MNEKLQYASMLEIPVSTCSVTFKPLKKKKFFKKKKVDHESVKKQLLDKINSQPLLLSSTTDQPQENQLVYENDFEQDFSQDCVQEQEQNTLFEQNEICAYEDKTESVLSVNSAPKKSFKVSIIGVQLAIIGALIATIFLTNAFYPTSGVNVFLRNVFGTQNAVQTDDRVYADFAPVINLSDGEMPVISDGVLSVSGKGSVYAPCDGTISAITKLENGKYDIEITHSENFKSVLTGIDFAYAGLNDKVYSNIPVGYVMAGATMCFKGVDDVVISDFQIIEDTVVWAV